MALPKGNFRDVSATETQSCWLWRIPRWDTEVFLPRSVFRNIYDQKASCWMTLRPKILSTVFPAEWWLLLHRVTLKRKSLIQADDLFFPTEIRLLITRRSFYDSTFLVHIPGYSNTRGKGPLHKSHLYTQCLWEKAERWLLTKGNFRTIYALLTETVWGTISSFLFSLLCW